MGTVIWHGTVHGHHTGTRLDGLLPEGLDEIGLGEPDS